MSALSPPPPAFPPNPVVGQPYLNWVWNGSSWVCRAAVNGPTVIIKVFNASGTYWPSPGLTFAIAEAVGGGGGGGDAATANSTFIVAGGGGGSGGYSKKVLDAALLTAGVQVTVGAGGGADGSGGASSFGNFCIAYGGGAGVGNNGINTWGGAGPGAPRGVGDLAQPGSSGDIGSVQIQYPAGTVIDANATGGMGGVLLGGDVALDVGVGNWSVGANGTPNTGAGGTGGCINQSTHNNINVPGGNGGSGYVLVTEWCFGNTSPVQDCGCGCGQPTPVPPPSPDPCAPCAPAGQNWWGPSW